MVYPVSRGAAGAACVLEAEMKTFHHPVRLRVVGCRQAMLDVEQAAEGGPQGGGELGPAV